jgi:HAD superfamily hydrolase (TIGR01484 family)
MIGSMSNIYADSHFPSVAMWREIPPGMLRGCLGVMTDIDDTLTREGLIESQALEALHALHLHGVPVIAITGRPMGWSEGFARVWPVSAIVAENGGVTLRREPGETSGPHARLRLDYAQDEGIRAMHAQILREVAQSIVEQVPGARLAADSDGRVTDIAIDHSEHTRLDEARIARVVAMMRAEGMRATVSSIHINGWFGTHDKWSGARAAVRLCFGRELTDEVGRWIYVGDSTNDQIMFQRVPTSVGVANLRRFAAQLEHWPAYITLAERGAGFMEVARSVIAHRDG